MERRVSKPRSVTNVFSYVPVHCLFRPSSIGQSVFEEEEGH